MSRCTFNLNFHIFLFEPQHFQSSFPQIRYGSGFTFRNYHSGNTVSRTLYSTQGQNKVIQYDCFVIFFSICNFPVMITMENVNPVYLVGTTYHPWCTNLQATSQHISHNFQCRRKLEDTRHAYS